MMLDPAACLFVFLKKQKSFEKRTAIHFIYYVLNCSERSNNRAIHVLIMVYNERKRVDEKPDRPFDSVNGQITSGNDCPHYCDGGPAYCEERFMPDELQEGVDRNAVASAFSL